MLCTQFTTCMFPMHLAWCANNWLETAVIEQHAEQQVDFCSICLSLITYILLPWFNSLPSNCFIKSSKVYSIFTVHTNHRVDILKYVIESDILSAESFSIQHSNNIFGIDRPNFFVQKVWFSWFICIKVWSGRPKVTPSKKGYTTKALFTERHKSDFIHMWSPCQLEYMLSFNQKGDIANTIKYVFQRFNFLR